MCCSHRFWAEENGGDNKALGDEEGHGDEEEGEGRLGGWG